MSTTNNNSYYQECKKCPYFGQSHLSNNENVVRSFIPVKLEDNKSNILLVFQAPGINEWRTGLTIQPTRVIGGSAGVRILNSWKRKGKVRANFNIVEAVRCYPGKNTDGRDEKPTKKAIECCSKILEREIKSRKYNEIIVFGTPAKNSIKSTSMYNSIKNNIKYIEHPNSSKCSNSKLDSMW
ncbi:uracil-DNA glycosylase family protein [Clostridium tyrobutyricum]|uniref:uracil-DNA glycosylase family protein n=1 Tax=Clostridium tyrobutyricum TaxID=1519 RepID=UPI001C383461|nr:uracil-DNA glycosylase family protein [Clostridium tyrobutyricum]MBV4429678.1 hypothetical protein [Clostridium tyrobutyricum]MBV4444930.1 hypothetical protein [Clostridium tyrobutyricum]